MAKVKEACILKQNLMDVSKGTFVLKTVEMPPPQSSSLPESPPSIIR